MQAHQPLAQFLADLRVHRRERFVQQQHIRIAGQGAGDGDPLSLPAGKLVRIALLQPLQLQQRDQFATRAWMRALSHFLIFRPKAMFLKTVMVLNRA